MTPATHHRMTTNPGLPGFARFWGYEISRSGNSPAPEWIEPPSPGYGKLSLKKVFGACLQSVTGQRRYLGSFGRREVKTFFEESFLTIPARTALKHRETTDEEGLSMASTQ